MRRRSPNRGNLRSFYVWHRRVGLGAAFLVLILCVTGLALNHTESLGLDEHHIGSSWLLEWYGIGSPEVSISFRVDDHWISLVEDRVYLDRTMLDGTFGSLAGVVSIDGTLLVIADGDALVLTGGGDLVERLGRANGVPAGIQKVGLGQDGLLTVAASHGLYQVRPELVGWEHADADLKEVDWSVTNPLPVEYAEQLVLDYRSRILTLERIMLDLHSGRIAGPVGVVLMDLAAIVLLLLVVTGTWIWVKRFN